jgi:hypothetical protein
MPCRRRTVLVVCVAAGFAVTALAVWWATRPSPYRQAFDLVEIGMTSEAADAELPTFTESQHPREKPVLLVWEAETPSGIRRVRSRNPDSFATDPIVCRSRLMAALNSELGNCTERPGRLEFHDPRTGERTATLAGWGGREIVSVVYSGGRVVEKAYWVTSDRPAWLRFLFDQLPF